METNYKETYAYGVSCFKDSLKEICVDSYKTLLPYFDYPLSSIENEVELAKIKNMDNNDFYKEMCDEIFKMYERLLHTVLICKSSIGTVDEKIQINKFYKTFEEKSVCKLVRNIFTRR